MSAPDTPVDPRAERYNAVVEEDATPGSTFWYWRVFRDGKLLRDGYRLTSESARDRADHEIYSDIVSGGVQLDQATRLSIAPQPAGAEAGHPDFLCPVSGCDAPEDQAWHAATSASGALTAVTAAWAQHFDDTAAYAGGFTEPERNGLRAAARMMRDVDVRARVHSTIGGGS